MIKKYLFFLLGILLIGIVSATTTCCEKTTGSNPAWCQNVNTASLCDSSTNPVTGQPYRAVSSFCESTSYCKLGTCINQQEGICISEAQIICQKEDGFWSEQAQTNLPQCKLGCCLVGDQAAFVTQVRCNQLASQYGLDVDYRADINNELDCLASANLGTEGACTYTENGVKNCERTTRKECQDREKTSQADYSFHEGFLCSAQNLSTICAKSQNTICEGDDVYFVDTCGNLANIYDANKSTEENYWTFIQEPTCTSSSSPGNQNSATCGDCDYYYGSMCGDKGTKPVNSGNYICKSLDCEDYDGPFSYKGQNVPGRVANKPLHGDTWCATDNRTKETATSPGSTYFRLICYNGDVTVEECGNGESGATRQMICSENKDTRAGNCKVNVWQDCTSQKTEGECTDINVRDCSWVPVAKDNSKDTTCSTPGTFNFAPSIIRALFSMPSPAGTCSNNNYGFSDVGLTENSSMSGASGACVPKYSPGFERDGSDTTIGGEICAQAQSSCLVTYEQTGVGGILSGGWKCINNCACKTRAWAEGLNNICKEVGDCGIKPNYIGDFGINTFLNSVQYKNCSGGSKRDLEC